MLKIIGVKRQILISTCMYLGQVLAGCNTAWSGPVIPMLQNLEESPLPYMLSETEISLVGSIIFLGGLPGPFLVGWLSNYKGRKPCFVCGGIFAIIANIILLFTNNLAMLYIGRLLSSCGVSIIVVINVVYIGEMASTNIRGILLAALGMFTTCGSIIMYSIGPFYTYQVTVYIVIAAAVIFTAATLTIPESPMYYVMKDDENKVIEILKELGRVDDKDILFETKKQYSSTNDKMDWVELFTIKTNKRSLCIVMIMNILQHLSGVMVVTLFSSSIFQMANSSIDYNYGMIIIGFFQFIGSAISPSLIDNVGRKILLLFSSSACGISMMSMGIYFYLEHLNIPALDNVKWLPLVILIVFFIGYDSGIGIIPNCLIGEMFTTNVRGKGSCVVFSVTWTVGFVLTTIFGYIVENLGSYVVFWFFSFSCACSFVFTIFFIPETKKKSLLEIQQFLGK